MNPSQKKTLIDRLVIVVPLLIFMLGMALANEHRITVVEQGMDELRNQTAIMYENQKILMQTQSRVTTILDMLCTEREIEMGRNK